MSPTPGPKIIIAKLEQIEAEMKRIGLWQAEPLEPEKYDFRSAFAMDRMAFSQWLQFVFLPRVQEAAVQERFPSESNVAAQLITLLNEFDALF
jgi:uncharacterized protein YqcC (DUF446 family)